MAVMTSSDVLKINNAEELVGLIDEVIKVIPEMGYFEATPVAKTSYKTLCLTGLPTVGFRATNTYRPLSTAVLGNKTVDCKYLDASWVIDKATASEADWGKEFVFALQAQAHLKAAFFAIAQQTWYGVGVDAGGFNGLHGIIDAVVDGGGNKTMVIDANPGSTITDGSSVFAVRTGLDSVQYAWGAGGKFEEGEIGEQLAQVTEDLTLKGQPQYFQNLGAWIGLQVTSKNAAAKICNLSATATKNGLDDDLLYELISKFPAGQGPTAFFMNRRSLMQLRKSRTATNATGAPAPIPTEVEGIPIFVTDAINSIESNAESSSSSSSSSEESSSSSSNGEG